MTVAELKDIVRDIPDFPKEGVLFKDITTLLKDPAAFKKSVDLFVERFGHEKVDYVVGIESRGFIFGGILAYQLGAGFIPVRKSGKLPYKTRSREYQLEYGTDALEIHDDALEAGKNVLIVDDLLATGGTVRATIDLVESFDCRITGIAFLIELKFLKGQQQLENLPFHSLIQF